MKIFGPDEEEIPPPPPIPEEDMEEYEQAEPGQEEEEIKAEEAPKAEEKKKFSVHLPKINIPRIIKKEKLPEEEKKIPEEIIAIKPEGTPTEEVRELQSQGMDKARIASDLRSRGYEDNAISDAVFELQINEIEPDVAPVPEIQEQEKPEELPAFPKMDEKVDVQELKPVEEEVHSEFPKPVEPILKKDAGGRTVVARGLLQKVFMKKEPLSALELMKRQEQMLKEIAKAVQKTAM